MTADQRLRGLALDIETISRALHLTLARVEWLCKQVAETATEDDLNELERVEISSMLDTALYSSASEPHS